jgi:uncharacterized protein YukE
MSWYGDPEGLDRLGGRLAESAARVREQAARIRARAAGRRWRGTASDAFAVAVVQETARLDRAAGELDDASAAMHAHAEAVRAEIARLLAVERATERLVTSGWTHLRDLVS